LGCLGKNIGISISGAMKKINEEPEPGPVQKRIKIEKNSAATTVNINKSLPRPVQL